MSEFNRIGFTEYRISELKHFLSTRSDEFIIDNFSGKKVKDFFAFRPDNITVYRNGRHLYKIVKNKGKFEIIHNKKFLPYICSIDSKAKEYTLEECKNYIANYDIKMIDNERDILTTNLTGPETMYVSKLYKFQPMAVSLNDDILLIDIEASFNSKDDNELDNTEKIKDNRIDVVLYNKKSKSLAFIEVKRLYDERLWGNNKNDKNKDEKSILSQLTKYENLIKRDRNNIIKAYNNVIRNYSFYLGKDLGQIEKHDIKLGLLITEYSRSDKEIMKGLISKIPKQFKCFSIGNTENVSKNTLKDWWGKMRNV